MKIHTLRPWTEDVDNKGYLELIEDLKKGEGATEIRLLICNYGGSSAYAFSFYDIVTEAKLPLTTIGSGEVSSAAIIVWLAGKRRLLTPHTRLLLHETGLEFKNAAFYSYSSIRSKYLDLRLGRAFYADIVCKSCTKKLSKSGVYKLMKEETIITPKEAVRLGLAHGITR